MAQDHPDLSAHVFTKNIMKWCTLLLKKALFGKVIKFVSLIEFQKIWLAHTHILLILENECNPTQIAHYNKLVCVELPYKTMFPNIIIFMDHMEHKIWNPLTWLMGIVVAIDR